MSSFPVSPWAFSGKFAKLGYHIQTAFYCMGYRAITGRALYPKCAAVESAEPHDVIMYDLSEVVDVGEATCRELLDKLHACMKAGAWPGQAPSSELVLTLPKWIDGDDEGDNPLEDIGLEGFT